MNRQISLQDQYAPNLICFGCGPANEKGLQIKSYISADEETVVAQFEPQPHHAAFEGIVNGGIIGVVLDCHLNWTAAWHLMQKNAASKPPCSVTAKYEVTFEQPTPTGTLLEVVAWIEESSARKAIVAGTLSADGQITARATGTFVAVQEGHPAFHRW